MNISPSLLKQPQQSLLSHVPEFVSTHRKCICNAMKWWHWLWDRVRQSNSTLPHRIQIRFRNTHSKQPSSPIKCNSNFHRHFVTWFGMLTLKKCLGLHHAIFSNFYNTVLAQRYRLGCRSSVGLAILAANFNLLGVIWDVKYNMM